MKVEVRQFLADVELLRKIIVEIRFWLTDTRFMTDFPAINMWTQGDISLATVASAEEKKEIVKRLAKYGVDATVTANGIQFPAKSDDDIIVVLHHVVSQKKLLRKSYQLDTLHKNVEQTARQLPHVHSSVFSRGVNALKNQVQVLENIRQTQLKEMQK